MMKKVLMLLLLVCLVLPVVVFAGPPHEDVEGYFYYIPLGCDDVKWAGDNFIMRDCRDEGFYEFGDFLGTSSEVYDFLLHGADPEAPDPFGLFEYEEGWYKGTTTFTGTVAGKTGTMVIMFVGKSPGDLFTWSGTWRILSGTGGLANIHGNGTWGDADPPPLPGYYIHYEGRIHFSPY
jgi:hypothetical protein